MTNEMSLGGRNVVAFVPIRNADRAKSFYRDLLGLALQQDERPFALVFEAQGVTLRLAMVGEFTAAPWTVLGWEVPAIEAAARHLASLGVRMERYEGMEQDQDGVWNSPSGAKVAWFKDPDGNVLSLTELPPGR
ncbi:MAG TPA: VOC family protein [Terracidiphilus sp.]|nr:VOC family protein [Terracidiphilus sp.]